MIPSIPIIWRVFALLGVLSSTLGAEAVILPKTNTTTYVNATTTVASTESFTNSGHVLAIPLKRVNHEGITTPSIAKRFLKTEVFGVSGAAYLAECMIPMLTSFSSLLILLFSALLVSPDFTTAYLPNPQNSLSSSCTHIDRHGHQSWT
ncbi:hypothetical protein F4808DRAFT_331843 [Astrocystis sublimbata]|nr:hypothetical protein F4808DRAFT_331843 [Astrocystis sublimbata]